VQAALHRVNPRIRTGVINLGDDDRGCDPPSDALVSKVMPIGSAGHVSIFSFAIIAALMRS
jgi:hypothetical protein